MSSPNQEIVDCVVASVEREIITLTDLKLMRDFIFIPAPESGFTSKQLLEKAIEMKTVLVAARAEVSVSQEEIDHCWRNLLQQKGVDFVRQRMEFYGISRQNLEEYLQEKILYEKIISLRTSQRVSVTLKEIENFYSEKYIPEQKAKNLEVPPLVEVLTAIEARLRQEKLQRQIEDWVQSLKSQVVIRIQEDCLKFLQ